MLELSRGTAYGVGISQCAVTLGVVLFFPPVDVDVYLIQGHINLTARTIIMAPASDLKGIRVFMAMPMLLTSVLAAVFSTVTCNSYEMGFAGQDYQPDVMDQVNMWNLAFWLYCLLVHLIVVFTISDPVDIFGSIAATSFMVYFLYRVCYPKIHGTMNLTQENLNILCYCLGVLQMSYQLTDTRPNGVYVIMLVVVLDYFLGLGHTYDRQATLETVANCRLFYICIASLSLAFLYAMSSEPPDLSTTSSSYTSTSSIVDAQNTIRVAI